MATWNADNVVLTQLGNEVLSKVQAGVGKLTISRIVSGGGYVSPAQLYRQTAVTSPKQELTATKTLTDEKGSEIALVLSNAALTEEYDLYQLGVYVTHPDYTGEILYVIAQCDTASPDHIPLPSVTVATMAYSLYMEHSGVSSIEITIDPAGQLTMADLDIPGGVPSLDENGKVKPVVVPGDTTYFATCATAVGTAAKVVVAEDVSFSYEKGKRLSVLFTNGVWSTTNPTSITLNVNSLGAKSVIGFENPSKLKLSNTNTVVSFLYDGTRFIFDGLEVSLASSSAPGAVKIANIITGSASDVALSQVAGNLLKEEYNKKLGWITATQSTLSAFVAALTGPAVTLASFSDGPVTTSCVYKVYTNVTAVYAEVFDITNAKSFYKYGASQTAFNSATWEEIKGGSGGGVNFATCSTAAGTAAKTVTITDFEADSLVAGFTLAVAMSNANTVANPTMNVSSTGAKAIVDKLSTALTTTTANLLSGVCILVYNGTNFVLASVSMATSSYFGAVKLSDSVSSSSGASSGVAATPYAVKTANDNAATAGNKSKYYGTCTTAAATGAKVVTCSSFVLETGAKIAVKFSNINTASNVTLNVNSTGAKTIVDARGSAISSSSAGIVRGTGFFVYDGTYWVLEAVDFADRVHTHTISDITGLSTSFAVTLPASVEWVDDENLEYYYCNLTVAGMLSTYDVVVDFARTGVIETDNARATDFNKVVFDVKTYNGYIQVRKYVSDVATVDLPLLLKV